MTFLFIASMAVLVLAIWVRFSKDEKTLTQLKTDILLARKIAEKADLRCLDLIEQVMGLKHKAEVAFEKASTADYIAHSAKMDASRVQQHSITLRLRPTKKKLNPQAVEKKIVEKVKAQIKDLSQ